MKKIRILYTLPNFDTAGSGKVVYDLIKHLDKNKFEVFVMCNHSRGLLFDAIKELEVHITIQQVSFPLTPYFSLFKRIKPYKDFVRKNKIDVVHSWHWSSDWTEILAAKWGGAKFIYTKKAMSWGNKHWLIRTYLSDFVVTLNEEMKLLFPWKKKQKLIPLGIDTDFYSPSKTKSNTVFTIVLVAHLVPVKGVEVLLHALEKLNQKQFRLHIIGDDSTNYSAELKKLTLQLKLEHHVFFLGKQTQVKPFLEEADLMVMSSFKEGMPMAMVEGMSMGIPILGSDIPGIQFVLRGFEHLLFPTSNSEVLTEKIKTVMFMSPQQRIELGIQLREQCMKRFRMVNFIESHELIYKEVIKS
jgi:glycosyltransferase involved in cell wall biosynthesis